MGDINNVTIVGRLTRDPELKVANSGAKICNFSVANNQHVGGADKTYYFNCTSFNKIADVVTQHFKKGSRIGIVGQMVQDVWETDGKKMSAIKINVNSIMFLDAKKKGDLEQIMDGEIVPEMKNPFDDDQVPY